MAATLRNNGTNRVHGVTLRVVAQEVTLGGKGSVPYPSLNVGPGETFQVRIDMRLMRLRGVWTANAAALLIGVGMYASFLIIPELVQAPATDLDRRDHRRHLLTRPD